MNTNAIIGLVLGIVTLFILGGVLIYYLFKRNQVTGTKPKLNVDGNLVSSFFRKLSQREKEKAISGIISDISTEERRADKLAEIIGKGEDEIVFPTFDR